MYDYRISIVKFGTVLQLQITNQKSIYDFFIKTLAIKIFKMSYNNKKD